MSTVGAPGALRGFRLQALYILHLLLQRPAECVFQLEGREDLEVLRDGNVTEAIQVKAHEDPLTLSVLQRGKPNTYFRRVLARRSASPTPIERLVSFGPFGHELENAWRVDGPDRVRTVTKLQEEGYTSAEANILVSTLLLERVDAEDIERTVFASLKELMTGVDPRSAFELLHMWLFRACECQARVGRSDLLARIDQVGRFLHERSAHHQEWYRTIIPLLALSPDDPFSLFFAQHG